MNILVIGKNGQLATELNRLSSDENQITCIGRDGIDITDIRSIEIKLKDLKPNVVINASAYTAVDLAETETEQANEINGNSVGKIAQICKKLSIHLIHVSTDFVFDGTQSTPYLTTNKPSPINVYGASKALGEELIINILPESSCIIRTSWVYSIHGNNFVKTMLSLMESKPELGIISDQIGTPTYAKVLAQACIYAACNKLSGIYHWTDQGIASWYDFAIAIQEIAIDNKILTKKIPIKAITTADYPTPAKRPNFSVLDKSNNSKVFPPQLITHWRKQLNNMLKELSNGEL